MKRRWTLEWNETVKSTEQKKRQIGEGEEWWWYLEQYVLACWQSYWSLGLKQHLIFLMFNFPFPLSRPHSLSYCNSPPCFIFPCHFLPPSSPPTVSLCSCHINRSAQSAVLFSQYGRCEIKWKRHRTLFDEPLLSFACSATQIGRALSLPSPFLLFREHDSDKAFF